MEFDNDAIVPVPAMMIDDDPLTIMIRQIDGTSAGGARYAYEVIWQDIVRVSGDDLYGPAHGIWPEARDMAVTLASFLGGTFECGEVTEHGREYLPGQLEWLEMHAERLSMWAAGI